MLSFNELTTDTLTNEQKEALQYPVNLMLFELRIVKALHRRKIHTLYDLVHYSETDIARLPGLGPKSLGQIIDVLRQYRLEFDMDLKGWELPWSL